MSYVRFLFRWAGVILIVAGGIFVFSPLGFACTSCMADLDTNGTVDGSDLAMFASAYGGSGCLGSIYVDNATGDDSPGNGCAPETPYKTISYAVAQASICSATTIYITPGTYVENIVIQKDNITLRNRDNNSQAVVIEGSGADVIRINGAKNITLSGMTVQNGKVGIFPTGNAYVKLENIDVRNMTDSGVKYTLNASGSITNCSVQNAGKKGFFIFSDSFVYFFGNISAADNGEQGIAVSSSGAIFENAQISLTSNGKDGLFIYSNSNVTSSKSTLQSKTNSAKGIGIYSNSSLILQDLDDFLAEGNTTGGIILEQSSVLRMANSAIMHADNNPEIGIYVLSGSILENGGKLYAQGNIGMGVNVWASSGLVANSSASELYIRNTVAGTRFPGFGLGVFKSSSCNIRQGAFVSENNASKGVYVTSNSHIDCLSGSIIQNNAQGGMLLEESSSARLDNVQIKNNTTAGIQLFQNSNLRSAGGFSVQGNTTYGIHADDDSSADLTSSTIQTNGTRDIKLEFKSRLTLRGTSVIGTTDYEDATLVRNR